MNPNVAIKVSNVSKKYTIGKHKDSSFRSSLSKIALSSKSDGEDFWALKNLSFEVQKGTVIGLIGKNGAGKSTLLKILSQITKPTEGRIEINGRVASLLEVGTGFHPDLTGRENVFLNGTLLGMSKKEVNEKFDEIVAFSGVEKFIDTPVKHYSSGMYVRLAFAVAAHLEPEILIIDEVLAVGDAEFQKKCLGKMKDVSKEGRTVIFVSHNIAAIKSLCTHGVLISNGEIVLISDVNTAVHQYLNGGMETNNFRIFTKEYCTAEFALKELIIKAANKQLNEPIDEFDGILICPTIDLMEEEPNIHLTFVLNDDNGNPLFTFSHLDSHLELAKGTNTLCCSIPEGFLNIGTYYLSLYLIKTKKETIFVEKDIMSFTVQEGPREIGSWMGREPGFIKPRFNWSHQ